MNRLAIMVLLAIVLSGCATHGMGGPQIDYSRTTDFKGGVLDIFVEDDLALSTDRDVLSTAPYAPDMPGHTTGRSWTILSRTEEHTYLAYALASWNADDPSDYLSAGWWVRFDGDKIDLAVDENQYIVFWDGPDADLRNIESLPSVGTAYYDGPIGGRIRYAYGENWGEHEGRLSLEEFSAHVTLEADFEAGTLSGCIGCVGDFKIQRIHLDSAFALLEYNPFVPLIADPKDYEIHIAPFKYNSDGTYQATDTALASVNHPEREVVDVSRLFLGGSFSGLKDADDNPRVIGGFLFLKHEEADGSSSNILGVFSAPSETFRGLDSVIISH